MTPVVVERSAKLRPYTTRLQKGGAVVPEMRRLVLEWDGRPGCAERLIQANVLSLPSRLRARDLVSRVFVPRFVRSSPADLWRALALLEQGGWRAEQLLPIHYYLAAAAEPLLWDFVVDVLHPRQERGQVEIPPDEGRKFLERAGAEHFPDGRWSPAIRERAGRAILTTLRDFGVLSGGTKKRLTPLYLPTESFAFVAYVRHVLGQRGRRAMHDDCWQLFFLNETAVERFFVEAHQRKLLEYHAAGSLVRVEFPAGTPEDYARELAQRAR